MFTRACSCQEGPVATEVIVGHRLWRAPRAHLFGSVEAYAVIGDPYASNALETRNAQSLT